MLPRIVTAATAERHGLSRGDVRGRLARGEWQALHRGIYLTGRDEPTWLDRVVAATVATGGVASYATAARLHGFDVNPTTDAVHVTVTRLAGKRQRPGMRVHFHDLPPGATARVGGVPVTSPGRTAYDCARTMPRAYAVRAVECALRAGAALDDLTDRPLSRRLGRIVMLADQRSESLLETKLRLLLVLAGIPPSHVQLVVTVGGRTYRLDLAYLDALVAIEVDGRAHHTGATDFERDRSRQNRLVLAGWTVLRFTSQDISRRPAYVVATVRAALSACSYGA